MTGQQNSEHPIEMWLFGSILNCSNGNTLWKLFRYPRRPKHGALFDRFRSKAKVRDEWFLTKEFLLVAFVQATKSAYENLPPRHSERVIARICELLVDGVPTIMPPWQILHFSRRGDCADFFRDGLLQYLNAEADRQLSVFVERYRSSCGDINLPRFLTCGAWMFSDNLPYLKRNFDERVKQTVFDETATPNEPWVNYISDITQRFQLRRDAPSGTMPMDSSPDG